MLFFPEFLLDQVEILNDFTQTVCEPTNSKGECGSEGPAPAAAAAAENTAL